MAWIPAGMGGIGPKEGRLGSLTTVGWGGGGIPPAPDEMHVWGGGSKVGALDSSGDMGATK